MASRVYRVFDEGVVIGLVRAHSQAQAIAFKTANRFEARVADQEALILDIGNGIEVEDATKAKEAAQAQESA